MPARDCSRQICGFAFKTNDNECTTVGSQRSREISYRRTLSRARGRYCDRCSFPTLCRNIFRDRQQRLQFWNFAPASLSRSLVLPLVSITIPLQLGSATSKLLTPKTRGPVTHAFARTGWSAACKTVVASPTRRVFGCVGWMRVCSK